MTETVYRDHIRISWTRIKVELESTSRRLCWFEQKKVLDTNR